tara:strand:- start:1710 stop:1961 length:252 start_codon:yes stop_codon:yes gene_type:complete
MDSTLQKNELFVSLSNANSVEVDASWAILKYKEIGIYRKVACLSSLFNLDFESVLDTLPKDDEGRLLDYKTRHLIHDALLLVS